VSGAGFPDAESDPGDCRGDQINDGAEHENLECGVPILKSPEKYAEGAIGKAQETPGDETRDQEISWLAKISQYGDEGQRGNDGGGGDISLGGKAIENRNFISEIDPCGERDGKARADNQADAHGGIPERVIGFVAANLRTNEHSAKRPDRVKPGITEIVAEYPQTKADLARFHFRHGPRPLPCTSSDERAIQRYHEARE
jgi:hypothetical protein